MDALVWLHLVGAALWLGGLITLAGAVLTAFRTLPRDLFRVFVRRAGWTFAGISLPAWALIGGSGVAMAIAQGWPPLVRDKAVLGVAILVAAGVHIVTGRFTSSRAAVMTSRVLAVLIVAATLVIFWLGVLAAG